MPTTIPTTTPRALERNPSPKSHVTTAAPPTKPTTKPRIGSSQNQSRKPAKQMAAPIATASHPNKMSTAYLPSLLIYPRRYVFDGVPNWYYEPAPEKAQAFRKGKPGFRRRFAAPKGGWGCSGPGASRTGRPGGWSCPCQPRQDASVARWM